MRALRSATAKKILASQGARERLQSIIANSHETNNQKKEDTVIRIKEITTNKNEKYTTSFLTITSR